MLITFILGELFRMFCTGVILFVILSAAIKIGRDLMELATK